MRSSLLVGLLLLAIVPVAAGAQLDDRERQLAEDEQRFRSALPIDGKMLLDFFRALTLNENEQARIGELIKQLDSLSFKERSQATTALNAEGLRALPLLQRARAGATLERRLRLEQVFQTIDKTDWAETVAATTRLVKERQPDSGCGVLLAFVPFALDGAFDDVLDALCRLGVKDGKVDPLVLAALEDASPSKRAAAATVVGRSGTLAQRALVKRLLDDADAVVRFHAAQGLLAGRERSAVPALIALLPTGELALAERAEGLLLALADKGAPKALLDDSSAARQRCRDAWLTWWNQHEDTLDLAKADVALHLTNKSRLARKGVLDFLHAVLTGDKTLLERSTSLPFSMPGEKIFHTREELNAQFSEASKQAFLFEVVRVITLAEQRKCVSKEADVRFLLDLPRSQTMAVHVALKSQGRSETFSLIVRIQHGRGRVCGVVEMR
jgi:hypothetical protein